ncbi:MAG TPA: S8 family serine peptidase [Thermoleophilaceae bacterium]|nr:S8 family serine peptidase [Thermoleophilaceae bacterium]
MPDLHTRTSLRVEVRDARGDVVKDATVRFRPDREDVMPIEIGFDDALGVFRTQELPAGTGTLEVSHASLEGQKRKVQVGEGSNDELFILAEPGVPTYFREKVRVPVDAEPDLIGVTLARQARLSRDVMDGIANELGLEPQKVPELAERSGVRLYRAASGEAGQALARLAEHPMVEHAGVVVGMREQGFTHLTSDVVVRFKGPRTEAVRAIAAEYGYRLIRELVYAPSTYVLRWERPATLEILESIEQLASRDDVEWAEPSLVVTPEVDAVIPSDPLWPGLWDRQLIAVQDAWQHLQDAGLDAFGDPDIVLAVWDSGVQSTAGVPRNDDFSGTVSDGNPKVIATFDFDNMVADNDAPWSNHGSGVAGVASALANNPSPIAGQTYGLVGSAPNVRIMTLVGRTPYIDIEVADQYIWMAGFNPQSPLAGFPAAPPPRGADVITCSLTPGAGSALSGTARAALDFVTTFGRGGKGTLCFFSTGNQNMNNVTWRPYSAYEKCFGIAGTSIDDDGVTEIRFGGSGWGQIALSAPTQDDFGAPHDPPTRYKPWGAAHEGLGNLPSHVVTQTTMTAASAIGATSITVASVAGIAVNSILHLGGFGALDSEPARVTAVNAATNTLSVSGYTTIFTGGLINAHAAGTVVVTGPADHRNDFGGTSAATPLAAGVAALVLSADPDLTFIEARQILRDTAVKIDLANTDPVGQWLDVNGNPSNTSGLPAERSGWYGWGRVDAAAAVQTAIAWAATRDLVLRDNLADTGAVASVGAFWNSPDIWCRRNAPGSDPGALPANYATAGPHEAPRRGQTNWIYARVRNNGTVASLDAWVRLSITHFPQAEFTYPASFQPTTGPGDPLPSPMTPGTYFIGEAKVSAVPPGGEQIVNVPWPAGLIPPETVSTGSGTTTWHPCLLAEITPHDGPPPTGNHVWDDNNMAQKNISIVNADEGMDFSFITVLGNEENEADHLILEVIRGKLPREVELYVDLLDPGLRRRLRKHHPGTEPEHVGEPWGRSMLVANGNGGGVATLVASVRETLHLPAGLALPRRQPWRLAWHEGREVVLLRPVPKVRIPIYAGPFRLTAVMVAGTVHRGAMPGEYEIVLIQRQPDGRISGSATSSLTIGMQ